MKVFFYKTFNKRFARLSPKLQMKVEEAILFFRKNPFDPRLRNHALSGDLAGKRAFSAGGDLRIVFREQNNHILVIMLDVGTHNQVY